jgi:hypothetical protein
MAFAVGFAIFRPEGEKWARLGSNQGPPACEAGALPLSYAPRESKSTGLFLADGLARDEQFLQLRPQFPEARLPRGRYSCQARSR